MTNRKKQKFDIFLPVIDETFSLEQTIKIIEHTAKLNVVGIKRL